jgi:hypothetical protein
MPALRPYAPPDRPVPEESLVSQPFPPPVPDWAASTPDWPPTPSWQPQSGWAPSGTPSAPAAAAVATPRSARGPVTLGLVALAGVVAGAVGGAFLVTAVFVGSAESIGEGIGRGMVTAQEEVYSSMSEEDLGWYAGPPLDPSEIGEPTTPVTGPDPTLDAYAQACFEGDYQSCDDLYYESPPLSDYEEYGVTCGGRVKNGDVMACTDLE